MSFRKVVLTEKKKGKWSEEVTMGSLVLRS